MQKILFIDRDGTLILEPQPDQQVDSLAKLDYIPKAISAMRNIAEETDYSLVMVTNQDGLGTDSFPEDTFWPAHTKMLHHFCRRKYPLLGSPYRSPFSTRKRPNPKARHRVADRVFYRYL